MTKLNHLQQLVHFNRQYLCMHSMIITAIVLANAVTSPAVALIAYNNLLISRIASDTNHVAADIMSTLSQQRHPNIPMFEQDQSQLQLQ